MTDLSDDVANSFRQSRATFGPTFLIYLHILVCCVSLVLVADFYWYTRIVMFDSARAVGAAANVAFFSLVSILFTISSFSFGYVLGFYFYTMVLGYIWLNEFSRFSYDSALAIFSAFVSALAFLVPALMITSPIKQRFVLSPRALDRLLSWILILSTFVISAGAMHNFRLIGISGIYDFRDNLQFPTWLGYAMGVTASTLLPFAFACFVEKGSRSRAAIALLLLLLFYPVTLSKLALFAPAWLVLLAVLSYFFEARTSVVLSLLLPLATGVVMALLFKLDLLPYDLMRDYFGPVNFRMTAIPSSALDFYNDFFSTHEITYFCQISFLKPFVDCPYSDPLAVVMERAYSLGNFNASLFATEGIASVGVASAPLPVLVCGLIIAFGNRVSAGLSARFILLSGGVLPQVFLNVPLTTTMLTNGAFILFLLWYIAPRSEFVHSDSPHGSVDTESMVRSDLSCHS